MDLNVIYSKTAKGLRVRASIIGGLSSQLMKVLSHIDGTSKAETILDKYDEITEQKLLAALTQLETDGYIKAVAAVASDEEWALTTNFAPMEVEEFQGTISGEMTQAADDKAEAQVEPKIDKQAQSQAEYKAKLKEEVRLQAEAKAQALEEQALAKAEEKAQLEAEAKAQAELEAKAEKDASKKAELKAADAAEEKRAKVQAEAKEKAKREIERMKSEANEAKKQVEAQAQIEAQLKAEAQSKADAERKAEEDARKKIELEAEAAAEKARAKVEAEEAQKQAEMEASAKAEEAAKLEQAREAEAKREAEAAEQARLEDDRKAKLDEAARLEAETENLRIKAEAEEKAKAETQAKAEEQERARQDIARIVREAEEARKKSEDEAKEARQNAKEKEKLEEAQKQAEAEATAKAELEAKQAAERQVEALEATRIQAESKLKVLAEKNRSDAETTAQASADANLKASLAMQSFAIDAEAAQKTPEIASPQAEEKPDPSPATVQKTKSAAARLKAEIKAKIEAEQLVLANYQAHQKALIDEKALAGQEMERISREAEAERKKQSASPSDSANNNPSDADAADAVDVRWISHPDDDEDDSEFEEEERITEEVEKVGREIKKKTKRVAEVEGREEIARSAKAEGLLKAKIKQHDKRLAMINKLLKWAAMARKSLLIYLPPAILLILGLLHIVNISPLVDPIEKLATESFGVPVKIEEVRASLWPRPHLVLKNVLIGADSAQKIDALNIVPDSLTLSDEVKTLRSLEMSGLKIEQANFNQPLQWISSLSKAQHLKVEQIQLNNVVIQIKDLESAPLEGEVVLTALRELKSINLTSEDDTLAMQITPQGSDFDVELTGTNWALPMNPKVVFSAFKATGKMNQNQIILNVTEGTMFGGSLTGKVALDWSNQWSIAGNFNLNKAILPEMLKTFNSSASVDGKLKLTGVFSSKSDLSAKLTDAPEISANFEVQNGKINDVELTRAVASKSNQSLAGDSTHFDKLTGSVKIKNGSYQYRQLALRSDQFQAEGNVDIQPNQDISGKISADLTAQSRRLQARFDLTGKVNNVKRQ